MSNKTKWMLNEIRYMCSSIIMMVLLSAGAWKLIEYIIRHHQELKNFFG